MLIKDGMVFSVKEIKTKEQVAIIKEFHTFFRHIEIEKNDNIFVCRHKDWEGNELEYIPTNIKITGIDGATDNYLEEFRSICENGLIDMSSFIGDNVKIEAYLPNCKRGVWEGLI